MGNDIQTNVSSGGWNCPRCGYWIKHGETHECQFLFSSWGHFPFAQCNMIIALERIATALENIAGLLGQPMEREKTK